ncbi:hypothetical protein [Glaciecola sp. 1036]|uniref:hypothetical protein n=1 Tax=Alteromonadaceae TaxID=72275 RepID=UPI003CFE9287
MEFSKLMDVSITHDFYDGLCGDLILKPVVNTGKLMHVGKMRSVNQNGQTSLFYQQNPLAEPMQNMSGAHLLFALVPTSTTFSVITQLGNKTNQLTIYRNDADPNSLSAQSFTKAGERFTYEIVLEQRPLTLTLLNSAGDTVESYEITAAQNIQSFTFELALYENGLYRITEQTDSDNAETNIAFFPELPSQCQGLLILTVDSSHYSSPVDFTINFNAREDRLNYYIVATKYAEADLTGLSVTDAGYEEQNRTEITFNKLQVADFTDQEIDSSLLTQNGNNVILFQSQSAVSRRLVGPKHIQLTLNDEVLFSSLPIPGSNRVTADFFIHVAKP